MSESKGVWLMLRSAGRSLLLLWLLPFLVVPWMWWTHLVLRGEFEVHVLPSAYLAVLCFGAPVAWSALTLVVLRQLRASEFWTWKWLLGLFAWPTLNIVAGDFASGKYGLFFRLAFLTLMLWFLQILFGSLMVRGQCDTMSAPRRWLLRDFFQNEENLPFRFRLALRLKKLSVWIVATAVALFAAYPTLQFLLGFENLATSLGVYLKLGPKEHAWAPFAAVVQMINLSSLLLLGVATLHGTRMWKASFVKLVLLLPAIYIGHLWFARYLLRLEAGLILFAWIGVSALTAWCFFLMPMDSEREQKDVSDGSTR